jgi:glycosyltransferase involved in cell wall biosynthesis
MREPAAVMKAQVARATLADTPIKVVITLPWGERLGGAENMLWTFLRQLNRERVQVIVVFFAAGSFEREVASLGVATVVLPVERLRNVLAGLRAVVDLAALLRRERPDVVLNWVAKAHIYGAAAARLAGLGDRLVWWEQGAPNHWLDRLVTLLPARAIGCSSSFQMNAGGQAWRNKRRFLVQPGTDVPLPRSNKEIDDLRDSLRIPPQRLVIGIVGRLQPWKGQDRVIRAIAQLRDRGHDVHGLIVGGNAHNLSPGYESQLHALSRNLDLSDRMTFTGQVPRPDPYVQLMDVFVNASVGEPFGIVLLEAMALGVPVVAFDLGGPSEIVDSGITGLLVPKPDDELLLEALDQLLRDGDLRRKLGRAGHERFLARFTSIRMANDLEDVLEELAHA